MKAKRSKKLFYSQCSIVGFMFKCQTDCQIRISRTSVQDWLEHEDLLEHVQDSLEHVKLES